MEVKIIGDDCTNNSLSSILKCARQVLANDPAYNRQRNHGNQGTKVMEVTERARSVPSVLSIHFVLTERRCNSSLSCVTKLVETVLIGILSVYTDQTNIVLVQ